MKHRYCIVLKDMKGNSISKSDIKRKERDYLENLFNDIGIEYDLYCYLSNDRDFRKHFID